MSILNKAIFVCVLLLLLTLLTMAYLTSSYAPTLVKNFSAPFIYGKFTVPSDNPLTIEAFTLGRRLFYDPLLSKNNQISCASCHQQFSAFSDNKTFSKGVSDKVTAFNSMSLANLLWGPQLFFWNGRATTLEEQVLAPIAHVDEMDQNIDLLMKELKADSNYPRLFKQAYGDINIENLAKAIATFERMLISSNSKYDQFLRGEAELTEEENLGRKLFMAHPDVNASQRGGNCIDCHSQFLTSGFQTGFEGFSNNGLDSEQNLALGLMETTGNSSHKGFFKTPSLRNIALTAPYMHDGRFTTLEQVVSHYNSGINPSETLSPLIMEANNIDNKDGSLGLNLTNKEQQALVAFLHTLTDEEFVNNPAFSDPFNQENIKSNE